MPELLTVEEVARTLRVCTATVRRRSRAGILPPPVRISSSVLRWRAEQISACMDALQAPAKAA